MVNELAQVSTELDQVKQELEETQRELGAAQQAEQAQATLEEVKSRVQCLQPKVQIGLLLMENIIDGNLRRSGDITQAEFFQRATKIWGEIEECLDNIGNEELKQKFTRAWFEPFESKSKGKYWAKAMDHFKALLNEDWEDLSQQLGTGE